MNDQVIFHAYHDSEGIRRAIKENKKMKKQKIDPADKAFHCIHFDFSKGYCNKKQHELYNGYAIKAHCQDCKYFKKKE